MPHARDGWRRPTARRVQLSPAATQTESVPFITARVNVTKLTRVLEYRPTFSNRLRTAHRFRNSTCHIPRAYHSPTAKK